MGHRKDNHSVEKRRRKSNVPWGTAGHCPVHPRLTSQGLGAGVEHGGRCGSARLNWHGQRRTTQPVTQDTVSHTCPRAHGSWSGALSPTTAGSHGQVRGLTESQSRTRGTITAAPHLPEFDTRPFADAQYLHPQSDRAHQVTQLQLQ
jgi:hypothetical protein